MLIRHVLFCPNLKGRMTKWAIVLSEFHISFKLRNELIAQTLADFIEKMIPLSLS